MPPSMMLQSVIQGWFVKACTRDSIGHCVHCQHWTLRLLHIVNALSKTKSKPKSDSVGCSLHTILALKELPMGLKVALPEMNARLA